MSPGDRLIELAQDAEAAVLLRPGDSGNDALAAWGGPKEWIIAEAPTIGLAVAELVPRVEAWRGGRSPAHLLFTPLVGLMI